MILSLQRLLSRYQAPAGDDGYDGGGADYGDETIDDVLASDDGDDGDDDAPDADDRGDAIASDTPAKDKREQRIPLSRHKDMLEKERAKRSELEQRLAQFQQGGQVAQLNENITGAEDRIMEMEKEYVNLLADGELDQAAALNAQIRRLERQIVEAQGDMKIAAAEARATERARYNIALERIESAYPVLNEDHDDYDAELMTDVIDLKNAYERKGLTPTSAMQKAVDKVVGFNTKRQESALETTPRVSTKDVAAERRKEGVTRTLDAVNRQPPRTGRVGMDSDKAGGSLTAKDVIRLSQDDFHKLPESALAKMRGDVL